MRLGVATLGVILVTGAVPQRGGPCSPGHLCLFGPDGRFRRRTGRRGSGPGEFQSFGGVHLGAGDTLTRFRLMAVGDGTACGVARDAGDVERIECYEVRP